MQPLPLAAPSDKQRHPLKNFVTNQWVSLINTQLLIRVSKSGYGLVLAYCAEALEAVKLRTKRTTSNLVTIEIAVRCV